MKARIFIYSLLFLLPCFVPAASCQENAAILNEEKRFDRFLDSLNNLNLSDFEKLNKIRGYLAPVIDMGDSRSKLKGYYKEYYNHIPWNTFPAFKCIALFNQNELTAKCGLSSHVLGKLYAHAGYQAYIYDCGYEHNLHTHEFILVPLEEKLIVQDAYYNLTILDSAGAPKDFFQLLAEIKACDFRNITIQSEDILTDYWMNTISKMDTLMDVAENDQYKKYVKEMEIIDDRLRISMVRNYEFFSKPVLTQMRAVLRSEGLCQNYLSIYLKHLFLMDCNTGQPADSLTKKILSITD